MSVAMQWTLTLRLYLPGLGPTHWLPWQRQIHQATTGCWEMQCLLGFLIILDLTAVILSQMTAKSRHISLISELINWLSDLYFFSCKFRQCYPNSQMLLNCGIGEDSWTARRSNQSILKEISPEYSLEELMLKLKLHYFGHLMQRTDSLEKTLMLGKIEGRRRRGW